jgi:hypothetical protein
VHASRVAVAAAAAVLVLSVVDGAALAKSKTTARHKAITVKRRATTTTTAKPKVMTTTVRVLTGTVSILGGAASVPREDVGSVDLAHLPLGTNKFGTSAARGSVYRCQTQTGNQNDGLVLPWISGGTFDLTKKLAVRGAVSFSGSTFSNGASGTSRVLAGNDLPTHTTGVFPVAASDPAYAYRPNPGSIAANTFSVSIPADPVVAASPSCLGGEIGVTTTGIELFNAFDAEGRDAVAEETQDHCEGHPNVFGYHYHSISNCLPDPGTGHSQLLGYAFDGFGIYGHRGEGGKVLTNADLDECHGHTHAVTWDGKTVVMYHYHATWEFPYVLGCFRGTSTVRSPAFGTGGGPGGPGLGAPRP